MPACPGGNTQPYQLTRAFETIENGLKGLGGDVWSEFAFMVNHLKGSLNDTDVIGGGDETYWHTVRPILSCFLHAEMHN
jgi:hypothetical protein